MPDYKELYVKMMQASEQAIRILAKAQRECEELYDSEPEAEPAGRPGKENAPEGFDRTDGT